MRKPLKQSAAHGMTAANCLPLSSYAGTFRSSPTTHKRACACRLSWVGHSGPSRTRGRDEACHRDATGCAYLGEHEADPLLERAEANAFAFDSLQPVDESVRRVAELVEAPDDQDVAAAEVGQAPGMPGWSGWAPNTRTC